MRTRNHSTFDHSTFDVGFDLLAPTGVGGLGPRVPTPEPGTLPASGIEALTRLRRR